MTASVPLAPPPTPPSAPLVIRVAFVRRNPPAGTASAEHGRPIPFDSWFDLLNALSRIMCDGAGASADPNG
jgi:hypothetical protein